MERALSFEADGADSIDVGGESTRPGSDYVSTEAELRGVIPVIEAIRRRTSLPISVDTRKSAVAAAAIDAGANTVNDISALRDDPAMIPLCAERGVTVVLMHMRGTPKTMQKNPVYADTVGEVSAELLHFAEAAMAGGVPRERIILDPGIGFGKRHRDNLILLKELPRLRDLGFPLLIGLSRKSFLGRVLVESGDPKPVEERGTATLAAHCWCLTQGVDYLRVHDVAETAEARRVVRAIEEAGQG